VNAGVRAEVTECVCVGVSECGSECVGASESGIE
jgi:hypothetical protein